MNKLIAIILSLLLLGLCSCGSSKNNALAAYEYDDEIFDDGSAEAAIAAELLQMQLASKANAKSYADRLLKEAYAWNGTPYRTGGHSKRGTDCSGYTMEVYRAALGIEIPRNSAKQSEYCTQVSMSKAKPGDLLFFQASKRGRISHVGIYLGKDKMIHASSRGVMVSDLTLPYWRKRFTHAGRVPKVDQLIAKEKKKGKKNS